MFLLGLSCVSQVSRHYVEKPNDFANLEGNFINFYKFSSTTFEVVVSRQNALGI